jgi:ribosomal protein S18 acetylase RimI-like enzyme
MYKVIVDHTPSHSDNDVVKEGLIKSYEAQFGERDKELSVFLKNDLGKVFGGMQAMFDSEAIYIEALWIEDNLRKQGYGRKLLAAAEEEAVKNGCRFSLVDTWDFQAEEFYLKNGYEKIGELKNYWHGHSKLFLRKKLHLSEFHFSPVESSQISLIHGWLQQDHIKEWIHGKGLQNTLTGLEKFLRGESDTTYWIGYHKGIPFAFLITSPEGSDATTLDLFICDLNYLGKGLAVPMIREFLISHFSKVKKVLIDPEASNERAIHVYQKAGFKIIGEFIASWHPVPHYQMELYMKDLVNPKKEIGA